MADGALPEFLRNPGTQIPAGSSVKGILTYRKRTKGGFPRYYLYSDDTAFLMIAAEEHSFKNAYYDISKNSCVFDKTGTDHVGTMYHVEGSRCCVVGNHGRRTRKPQGLLKVTFGREGARSLSPAIKLQFLGGSRALYFGGWDGDISAIGQQSAARVSELFPADQIVRCDQNQFFAYQGAACVALCRTSEDEYFFYVAHPLNLFFGFAIALSILRKVKPARHAV
jgi:hypothetical protein